MALRDTCAVFGTCEYMSRYETEFHLCHCDNKCTLYDDCSINSNFTRESDTIGKRFQCAIMEKSNKISSDIGIFVVDNIPDSYMISERYKLCNSNLSIAGPYVVDINGTVYKNKFCAECHNVFNYNSFTVKITINQRKTDKQYISIRIYNRCNLKSRRLATDGVVSTYNCKSTDRIHVDPTIWNNWKVMYHL